MGFFDTVKQEGSFSTTSGVNGLGGGDRIQATMVFEKIL